MRGWKRIGRKGLRRGKLRTASSRWCPTTNCRSTSRTWTERLWERCIGRSRPPTKKKPREGQSRREDWSKHERKRNETTDRIHLGLGNYGRSRSTKARPRKGTGAEGSETEAGELSTALSSSTDTGTTDADRVLQPAKGDNGRGECSLHLGARGPQGVDVGRGERGVHCRSATGKGCGEEVGALCHNSK